MTKQKQKQKQDQHISITTTEQPVNIIEKNIILEKGKKILQNNNFFYELNEIMKDDKFRPFYEKYFQDSTDVKTVLLYLKLYETLQKEYKERNNKDIEEELLVYTMKELMTNKVTQQHIICSFDNFFNTSNQKQNQNQPITKKYLLDIIPITSSSQLTITY
jgi:hypothetical protein